ncbi:MAG: HEAT repeat domain-containing protein [Candidatus Binatia bacterium]
MLSSPSAEAIREAAALVARMVEATTDTTSDTDTRSARARSLAFDELVARHPVVVEDGAAAVGAIADLAASLTDAERRRIEAALRRRDLPVRVRVAVVRLVGARHLTVLAPALGKLEAPAPEVLAASWDALRALGHAPAAVDLAPFVASRDAGVRAVAVAALLATAGADAIPQVERLALEDPDVAVRTAATQALGTSRLPAALPALAHVYKASPWDVRRAAGNAIVGWGDDDAAATLARLTFEAPPEAQKWALALLLSLGRTKADPLVDHIRTSHPDPTLRDIIDHGFDLGTEHHE